MHLKALEAAKRRGYFVVSTPEALALIDSFPKATLAEAALHLAALVTGEYDQALVDGRALARLREELETLKTARPR